MLDEIDYILNDSYEQKLKIIEIEKLIKKSDLNKITVLPYTKAGYEILSYIVLILNFISVLAFTKEK